MTVGCPRWARHWSSCRGEECEQSFCKWHNLVPAQFGLSINSVHKGNGYLLFGRRRENCFSGRILKHGCRVTMLKLGSDSELKGNIKVNLWYFSHHLRLWISIKHCSKTLNAVWVNFLHPLTLDQVFLSCAWSHRPETETVYLLIFLSLGYPLAPD